MNKPVVIEVPEHGMARPARVTGAQFLKMLDLGFFEDRRVELVRGELIEMSPAHLPHGRMVADVVVALGSAYDRREFDLCIDIVAFLDADDIRAPDVAVRRCSGAVTFEAREMLLAVEVADSSLPRDLGEKADDYARAGVSCYWVVDVRAGVTHVMTQPSASGYGKREAVRLGEPLMLPGLDGVTVTLA